MKNLKKLSAMFNIMGVLCITVAIAQVVQLIAVNLELREGSHSFAILFSIFSLVGAGLISGIFFYAGKFISAKKRFEFCRGVSIFVCFFFPLGTILGLYSLSVLKQNADLFEREEIMDRVVTEKG